MLSCGHLAFDLTVYGEPQAQERVKVYNTFGNKHGVDPKNSRVAKQIIRAEAQKRMKELDLKMFHPKMPVSVIITIYRSMPKRLAQWEHSAGEFGLLPPLTKPDVDNYEKLVLDAMSGVVFADDGQVFFVQTKKQYSDIPRTEISVWGHMINVGEVKERVKVLKAMAKLAKTGKDKE